MFLVAESVVFPKKCLVECSSLSENSDSALNLASGSQSWCAGTGGSNKWGSHLGLKVYLQKCMLLYVRVCRPFIVSPHLFTGQRQTEGNNTTN